MTPTHPDLSASLLPFSRRALVGSSLAAAALWRLGASPALGARQEAVLRPDDLAHLAARLRR